MALVRLPMRRLASAGVRCSSSFNPFQDYRDSTPPLPKGDPSKDSRSGVFVSDYAKYMLATYARPPLVFVKGEGSFLHDLRGRKYLDFTAGIAVNSLGHSNAELAALLSDQAKTLWHASNLYHNCWTGPLCKKLVKKTVESGAMHDAASVFLCNSGTEANEAAIKFSRKVGKALDPSGEKYEVVSFHGSFHGRTMGSLSATPNPKYQEPFTPMVPGFRYGTYNNLEGIDNLVTEKTCGVIVEPIQGEGGVNVASDEFLIALANRCRQVGAVLIYDEIQCGLSRTGHLWAHGHLPKEAHPDILTTAKALGNGFPIGAAIVNGHVSEKIQIGDHGTTFGGNVLACRVAYHAVDLLSNPELQRTVHDRSRFLKRQLKSLQKKFPEDITEIRGRGLILGMQLTRDPVPIVDAARQRGLLVLTCGTNTLRFVPPLTISEPEIATGVTIVKEAILATK
ncbi:putative acetylornithine aminotransferase precursor [Durotheca rogersii]|uniref:putative acetylornithine aminotransferase precursor n=1 Tax=Durotheca rogersii TaxID=419775 RepID=UPI00221FDB24|nr:putative acetylornithine aminotransferase precursor [Durotheca rogersii]KAI5860429.1 putative acetylornithine aminotransferase precursor [Durotheca rogersii]